MDHNKVTREHYCDLFNNITEERSRLDEEDPLDQILCIAYDKALDGINAIISAYDKILSA